MSTATKSEAIRFILLNESGGTVCGALFELIGIDFNHFVEVFQGEWVVLDIKMAGEFMSFFPDFPSLHELFELLVDHGDLIKGKWNAILIVPAALLPVFL